jgi:hypothetical protein
MSIKVNDAMKKELLDNYKYAKSSKEPINKQIQKWVDTYNGKLYGNEQDARSKVVVRDVYKTIESLKPNLTEPFIGSRKPIEGVPYTAIGEEAALSSEKLLNYQFTTQQDRRELMNKMASVLAKEGTVWLKNEWVYEDEEYRTKMTLPKETLNVIEGEYEVLSDDGVNVEIEMIEVDIIKNEGRIRVCRNEHIFTDPTAEHDDDIQFIIHQYDATVGDLKASGLYSNLDKLESKLPSNLRDTSLGTARDMDAIEFGRNPNYRVFSDEARTKVTLMEYWGMYDIDDTGIAVPVLVVWEKDSEIIIRSEKNPMPDKEIPFERAVYIEEPFSLWGKALADVMDDGQKIHTAFMRGIIDNAALANNGQKFIMKGGIDQMNFRRMVNGEKHIYTNQNPAEVIQDGSYNQMPQSMFSMYEMVETQNEGITGISRINQGLDAGAMSQTATGVSALTSMSQRRLLDTVRNLSNVLRKLLRRQLTYSLNFIEDEEWMRITGKEKPQGKLGKDFDIKIELITDAMKQTKISQFNLMLQNMQYIGEGVRFQAGNMILAKYFDLFDEPALADMIKNQEPPQPDPMQQQQMQLELQKLQAEVQKLQAESQKTMSEAQVVGAELETDMQAKQMELQIEQQKVQIEMLSAQQRLELDAAKAEQDMQISQEKAAMDILLKKEKTKNDIMLVRDKAKAAISNQNNKE